MNEEVETLYCNWCERKLVFVRERVHYYSRRTGEPSIHRVYACPMRRWLLFWHDRAEFYRNSEGEWTEAYDTDF